MKLKQSIAKIVYVLPVLVITCLSLSGEAKTVDSTAFVKLTNTFTADTTRDGLLERADNYFAATNTLNAKFQGLAAATISETLFTHHFKKEGENWYKKAIQLFKRSGDLLEAGNLDFRLGRLLTKGYDFETGLPYLLKSVDCYEGLKNYNRLVIALNNISLSYHDFGDYQKGIEYALAAKKILDAYPGTTDRGLYWYVYNNIGINHDDSREYQKAIDSHFKGLPFAPTAIHKSYTYNNLGNSYKKLNSLELAAKYLRLALHYSTNYNDQYHMASVYGNLVDIERLNKNYRKAHTLLDSAFYYARKSESPEKLLDIYYYTHLLKKETGDLQSSITFLQDYLALKDSFFSAEKNIAVLNFQARYETEKREKELAETQLHLAQQTLASRQKTYWLVLSAFVIVAGFLVFRYYRFKQRSKENELSLQNRLLQQQMITKVQHQRLDISRELHDSLGAQLTFIHSYSESLKVHFDKMNDSARNKIDRLCDFSQHCIGELKNALWVLHNDGLTMEDLKIKILNFINAAAEANEDIQFHPDFNIQKSVSISSRQAVNLLRLVQEGTNNAIKHAHASNIIICIDQVGHHLVLKIADDGIGFNFEAVKSKSYGLTNMQSRVKEMNGTIEIASSNRNGTSYNIEILL